MSYAPYTAEQQRCEEWIRQRSAEYAREGRIETGYIHRQAWSDWQVLPADQKRRVLAGGTITLTTLLPGHTAASPRIATLILPEPITLRDLYFVNRYLELLAATRREGEPGAVEDPGLDRIPAGEADDA